MKKRFRTIAYASLAIATLAATATATVTWFRAASDIYFGGDAAQINSGAEAAVYGGGNGTQGNPYIISTRRHLYNLAWRQYIGTYNDPNNIQQLYFRVDANIDMSGVTLPPIGTDQYPFLGNFNGNGKVISNVTISNDNPTNENSAFGVMKPESNLLEGTIPPQIVGFFGVVGRLSTQSITYNTDIVSMYNFTIDTIKVSSLTSQTLMGLAAGYVDGTMSGVKIAGTATLDVDGETTTAAISSITDKISDYGLVGYTTHTSRNGTFSQDISSYYETEDDEGGGSDWGGSIAVEEIYNRLMTIRNSYATLTNSPVIEKTYTYKNGTTFVKEETTKTGSSPVYEYNENTSNTYNAAMGAFQIGKNDAGSVDGIHYLSGGHYTVNKQQVKHQYRPITDGTNYLSIQIGKDNNNNDVALFANATSEDDCVFWNLPVNSTGKIYTINQYAGSVQYLSVDTHGTLALETSSSSAVTWTVTASNGDLSIVYGNYHLMFDEQWIVRDFTISTETYYYISASTNSGTRYFIPGTAQQYYLAATSNANNQIKWYYDSEYRAYYYMRDGASRYLSYISVTGSTANYMQVIGNNIKNSSSNYYRLYVNGTQTDYGTGVLRYSSGNSQPSGNSYIRWTSDSDGGWRTGNSSQANTFTIQRFVVNINRTDNVLDKLVDYYGPESNTESEYMDYSEQDVTYFPLNTNTDLTAAESNTGYVIGGSAYDANSTKYSYGTMRISNFYELSDSIKNYSRSTYKLTNVRTYGANGTTYINDTNNTYQRYTDAKAKVENILKKHSSENQVYGLHFMQNSISTDYLVTARSATINGVTHTNYQLPASSIDFNLKERGFVTFFAGTYGNSGTSAATVDSFFSLHLIRRSSSGAITNIYEIEEILSDGNQDHAYIYHLSNGKYTIPYSYNVYNQSEKYVIDTTNPLANVYPDEEFTFVNSAPTGYSTIFNTSWIKSNTYDQHYMYYFEIPINCGEFCLGSVSDGTYGAYLVYLDIGAFDRDEDKVMAYHVTTFANSLSFPDGVDFAVASATGIGGESMGIYLPTGITGSVSFVITESNIAITDTSQISTFSFKGTKFSPTAASGKFTTSGDPPGALVEPPSGGERLIHIKVDAVDGSTWFIDILDRLDANKNIISTSYPRILKNGVAQQQSAIPVSVTSVLADIRGLSRVVTFTRESGTEEFDTTAEYDEQTHKIVSTTVTSDNLSGITIKVSNLTSGYTVKINGTTVTNNSIYPSS